MGKKFYFPNQKIGQITLLEKVNNRSGRWLCLCDCGRKFTRESHRFKTMHGCKYCDIEFRTKDIGIKNIQGSIMSAIKEGANRRNIEYNITSKYVWKLYLKQDKKCALSGLPIHLPPRWRDQLYDKSKFNASLDRIDSNKGYIKGNVQWVDKNINIMKRSMKDEDFINLCKLVAKYNEKN